MRLLKILSLALIQISVCYSFIFAGSLVAEDAVNYFNEGAREQKSGNYLAANSAFQKALLVDPANPRWEKAVMNNRGIIYFKTGDFENAEIAFKEALRIDKDYKIAEVNLGLVYEETRSRVEALEYWAKVFELDKLKPEDFAIEEEIEEE
ncbi:MAG: tetratricopeptide repeat protein [Candidatus Omnitrophota bacterium]